jgi:tRNA (cmo5U34)-methyltransferase
MDGMDDRRFFTMAETYDKMARKLVPQYDFMQNEIIEFLGIKNQENPVIVDLGAGSGILIEKILQSNPTAKCYWVDYSEDFLNVAKNKLFRYGKQVEFIPASLDDRWDTYLNDRPDIVSSMSAIHHLLNEDKKALYARCFDILADGGWFINIDEMKTLYEDSYLRSLHYWLKYVNDSEATISETDAHYYNKWKYHFDNWKTRNIDNMGEPKAKGDDLHEVFTLQMKWLKEIGFVNVDVFIKYHLWCAIGGQKNRFDSVEVRRDAAAVTG